MGNAYTGTTIITGGTLNLNAENASNANARTAMSIMGQRGNFVDPQLNIPIAQQAFDAALNKVAVDLQLLDLLTAIASSGCRARKASTPARMRPERDLHDLRAHEPAEPLGSATDSNRFARASRHNLQSRFTGAHFIRLQRSPGHEQKFFRAAGRPRGNLHQWRIRRRGDHSLGCGRAEIHGRPGIDSSPTGRSRAGGRSEEHARRQPRG